MPDYGDEESLEETPPWSGVALVIAARGAERESGRSLVFDPGYRISPQDRPLIGRVWAGEVYIDTGSRTARSTSGVEEGFVLKTSVLLRQWDGEAVDERVLYPMGRGIPGFLLVRGDDRMRQASLYVAELGMVLSVLRGTTYRGLPEGRLLVVRHGSLLQSLGAYFNEVFDLDRSTAEMVLHYVGLDVRTVRELVGLSLVKRRMAERVSPGLLAVQLLREIKREAEKAGHTVVGLTEDVSRGRHLVASILAEVAVRSVPRSGAEILGVMGLVDLGSARFLRGPAAEGCLRDLVGEPPERFRYEAAQYLEEVLRGLTGAQSYGDVVRELSEMAREGPRRERLVQLIYERQALKYFNLASDSHLMVIYHYLYAEPGTAHQASVEVDKSLLYTPRILKSYRERIPQPRPLTEDEVSEAVEGFRLRYLFPEQPPGCLEIGRVAERLRVDRRLLAELIRIIPPVRVEYPAGTQGLGEALRHIYTQSLVTTYGVPPQLLVVDARSRVHEWEYGALQEMLEEMERRVTPYSSFIRDFSVRRRHLF